MNEPDSSRPVGTVPSDTPADPRQAQLELTANQIAGVFVALVALVGVVVTIDPTSIPLFYDIFFYLSMVLGVVVAIILLVHSPYVEQRYGRFIPKYLWLIGSLVKRDRLSHMILGGCVISGVLIMSWWDKPTGKQLAQQILDARGMRFEAEYYQTALEVGNASAIRLFHEAGFPPDLAYKRMARLGETNDGEISVDIVLDHEFESIVQIFEEIGKEVTEVDYGLGSRLEGFLINVFGIDSATAESTEQDSMYNLLTEPIEISPEVITQVSGEPETDPAIEGGKSEEGEKTTLLGRAMFNGNFEAVLALMSLGVEFNADMLQFDDWNQAPEVARLLSVDPNLLIEASLLQENTELVGALQAKYPRSAFLSEFLNKEEAQDSTGEGCSDNRLFRGHLDGVNNKSVLMDLLICNTVDETGEIEGTVRIKESSFPYYYKRLNYSSSDLDGSTRARYGTLLLLDPGSELQEDGIVTEASGMQTLAGFLQVTGDFQASNEDISLRVVQVISSEPGQTVTQAQQAGILVQSDNVPAENVTTISCQSEQTTSLISNQSYLINCPQWFEVVLDSDGSNVLMIYDPASQAFIDEGNERAVDYEAISFSNERIRLAPGQHGLLLLGLDEDRESDTLVINRSLPSLAPTMVNLPVETISEADLPLNASIQNQQFEPGSSSAFMAFDLRESVMMEVFLSGLQNDVDLYIEQRSNSASIYSSTNSSSAAESISGMLLPGEYILRLNNFTPAALSEYDLAIRVSKVDVPTMTRVDQQCLEYSGRSSDEGELIQFSIQQEGTYRINLSGLGTTDIDLELLDATRTVLNSSTSTSSEETIQMQLDSGVYFNRVYFGISDFELEVCLS